MTAPRSAPGALMAREMAEAAGVFARAASTDRRELLAGLNLADKSAFYTIARGSSDAAANVISYEMMRELGVPATSMPPSVFSLGRGVRLEGTALLAVSQSGASDDLVRSVAGARASGGTVVAITNKPGSAVEAAADATMPIAAGPELAVPATKTVTGAIGAGMSLIAALKPDYASRSMASAEAVDRLGGTEHPEAGEIRAALLRAQHVYVIGRDAGFGAAHEVALKLKECCALHAEAYSSSEVLHGPLQLATRRLTVLLLDTEAPGIADSLDTAAARLAGAGGEVLRVRPSDAGATDLVPAAAAAALLHLLYPVVHSVSRALGFDPDRPDTLAKETLTR